MTARQRTPRDRGAAGTAWMALLVMVMALAIGISVDLTGLVHAKQRAFDLAHQAGRAAGNQVDPGPAILGHTPSLDVDAAGAAATDFLAASGADGTVTITGPQSLHIRVTTVYQPKVLTLIGTRTVAGEADIALTRVVDGAQR